LHARCVEAGREVVHVGAVAGAVGTPRWQSALWRAVGKRPGGLGQSKTAWLRAAKKTKTGPH
jgi:hypothetical protein